MNLFERFAELGFVLRLDVFTNETKSVAVSNGSVVVVFVDVVAKEKLGVEFDSFLSFFLGRDFLGEERRSRETDTNGVGVGLLEVG